MCDTATSTGWAVLLLPWALVASLLTTLLISGHRDKEDPK